MDVTLACAVCFARRHVKLDAPGRACAYIARGNAPLFCCRSLMARERASAAHGRRTKPSVTGARRKSAARAKNNNAHASCVTRHSLEREMEMERRDTDSSIGRRLVERSEKNRLPGR